jgi:hypothetical protein
MNSEQVRLQAEGESGPLRADALIQATVALERALKEHGWMSSRAQHNHLRAFSHLPESLMEAVRHANRVGLDAVRDEGWGDEAHSLQDAIRLRNDYVHEGLYPDAASATRAVAAITSTLARLEIICMSGQCVEEHEYHCASTGARMCESHRNERGRDCEYDDCDERRFVIVGANCPPDVGRVCTQCGSFACRQCLNASLDKDLLASDGASVCSEECADKHNAALARRRLFDFDDIEVAVLPDTSRKT